MSVQTDFHDETLYCNLEGEIDHHTALPIRLHIDEKIELCRPKNLILDFSRVTFMDSSGIGLVMGRYARMQNVGGTLVVRDPSERVERILRLAGIERIVKIEKGDKDDEK